MPSTINIQWLQQWLQTDWFLVTAGIGTIVLGLLLVSRSRRQTQALTAKLQRLERELRAANSSAVGMGRQLIKMEKMLKHNVQPELTANHPTVNNTIDAPAVQPKPIKLETTLAHSPTSQDSSYNQARHYLSQGKSVEETVKACGLSYAEVSLLQALSKQSASIS
ncbi:MAG: DUF2802 domain-containing protein [Pseudomonadota bacterium]